jgi:hypothetical protein
MNSKDNESSPSPRNERGELLVDFSDAVDHILSTSELDPMYREDWLEVRRRALSLTNSARLVRAFEERGVDE